MAPLGCTGDDQRVDGDQASVDSCSTFTIPAVGKTAATITSFVDGESFDTGRVTALQASARVDLVASPDLPAEVAVTLDDLIVGRCASEIPGGLRINDIETISGASVDVRQTGNREVTLSIASVGEARVTVSGTITVAEWSHPCAITDYPPGSEIAFSENLQVTVVKPEASRWPSGERSCAAAVGRRVENYFVEPYLVSPAGVPIQPINASRAIGIEAVLCGADASAWEAVNEGGGIVMPTSPGTLTLEPSVGEPLEISIFDVADVSTFASTFQVAAFTPIVLEDGKTYGAWGRASRYIFGMLDSAIVGDLVSCSDVPPEWFTLRATPADVCRPSGECAGGDACGYSVNGQIVGGPVEVVADGECTLELTARGAAGGAGYTARATVVLQNVESMLE